MAYNKEMFAPNNYDYFYFEVRNERGKLMATFARRYEAEKYAEEGRDLTVTEIKKMYNTKENTEHYKGKIWVTKGYKTRKGCNICADIGREELMVISFVPEVTEEKVVSAVEAMGWRLEDWL